MSSVVNCVLFSFIGMEGTVGLLSPCIVLEIELKVSNPPKAIPFLRFSTSPGTVCVPYKYKYCPLGIHKTKCDIFCSSEYPHLYVN